MRAPRVVFIAICLFIGLGAWMGFRVVESREPGPYPRGDTNGSGDSDISDVIYLLQFLFRGGDAPICDPVSDMNADGDLDIGDAIYGLGVFFRGTGDFAPLGAAESAECDAAGLVACGKELFETPDPLGNSFACSHCHGTEAATEIASEGLLLPAHGLGDAAVRPSWFGGQISTLDAAINRCRSDWMAAPSLAHDDEEMMQMIAFLESLPPAAQPADALEFDIVASTTTGESAGSRRAGCELFARTCASCHGELGTGSELAPPLWRRSLTADEIREHVRLSGPTEATAPGTLFEGLLGNRMPFWSAQRLSDSQLEDIVAYMEVGEDAERRPCDQVDVEPPELVRIGTFITYGHGVRGRAEQWSDRRIRLVDFNYDGEGPEDVLVWLYDKDPSDFHAILRGMPISGHIGRERPYVDVTLEFEIPPDIELSSFDTVSIWCTAFQTNYGEAQLSR